MWDMTIEKLENHKYRLLVKWDGTEEMLNGLLEDGFSVFDGNNIYYSDYEDDCILFGFGMSMCECYQKLSSNRLFNIDYMLHFSRQPVDAELLKDFEERIPTYNIIKAMIDNWGMEPFLYLLAKNYDSLIDEATQRYHDSDEASFMSWLKESIDPRFTTQVSSDIYSRYLILNKTKFNLSDLFCGYWYAWQIVRDNWEEFKNWINRVEYADELDFQFYDSIFNQKDTIQKQFNIVYFYGYGKLARILFEMLNEPDVNYKVKKLIKDVLMEYAQSDSEFAEILQKMYSEYKSISGGIDIDFAQQVFENEMFVFPEDDIKYHLSHDLYDEDKDGFIGKINPIYNDPENLTRVFKELVKSKRVRPNELDTFIYRFTGQRKPTMIIDKIHWDGCVNDLLYLFKRFYGGSYNKIEQLFDVELVINRKNYSAYADRASGDLTKLFKTSYGKINA